MFKITVDKFEASATADLNLKSQKVIAALSAKMLNLMIRLQAKIVGEKLSNLPYSKTGNLARSIRNPRVEEAGGVIEGKLSWGGDIAPYAQIQEYGGVRPYVINPLGAAGTKGAFVEGPFGQPILRRGKIKGAILRTGAEVLRFWVASGAGASEGATSNLVFAPSVFRRKPLSAKRFIADSIDEMRATFVSEIKDVLNTTKW